MNINSKKFYLTIIVIVTCFLVFTIFIAFANDKNYKIGVIMLPAPYAVEMEAGLRNGLKSLGYIEGKNLQYILKVAGPEQVNYEPNKEIARQMIAAGVDLIATIGTGASTPVWQVIKETKVPMAFAGVTYPIQGKLIEAFGKVTGTNITGISYGVPPTTRLKIFRKMFPDKKRFKRLGFIYSGVIEQETTMAEELKKLATTYGFQLQYIDFYNPATKAPDFSILEANIHKVDLMFGWYTLDKICADAAILKKLTSFLVPILGITSQFTDQGAIGGVMTDHHALGFQHAKMIAKILSGISIAEIPPQEPSGYLIEVNLKKAQELNIQIPFEIIGMCNRVVK
jgi:ABC-type uncharacterized transport system substrate-binding protein